MHLGCMTTLAIGSNVAEETAGAVWPPSPPTASRPKINGARIVIASSSGRAELFLQGQLPNALAGRGEDGIGQRGPRDGGARFADSSRGFQVAHQVHFDGRRFVDPQHANIVEVGLFHPPVLERHLAPEGTADSE